MAAYMISSASAITAGSFPQSSAHWVPIAAQMCIRDSGDGDMLHLLDILRLRQVHVELTLEKAFYDSFSQEERMLLAPLILSLIHISIFFSKRRI